MSSLRFFVVLASVVASGDALAEPVPVHANVVVQPQGTPFRDVVVDNPLGDVRVEVTDGTAVEVDSTRVAPDEATLERVRVSLVPGADGRVRISVQPVTGAHVDLVVRVPRDARVETLPPKRRVPTGTFAIGAGYNPDDGFLAGARIAQPHLFGSNQGLSLAADISAIQQRAVLAYDSPDLLGSGLDLRGELFTGMRQYPTFARAATGGQLQLSHRLDRSTRLFVGYRLEQVTIDRSSYSGGELPRRVLPDHTANTFAWLTAGLDYDTRDQAIPLHGTHLELAAETSDPRFGSDAKLMRLSARLEHATDFGPFTLRLGGRGQYITGPNGVPFAERLQYDGNRGVRGYGIGALGDGGANGELTGRVELELPVWKAAGLSIAGFADGGVFYNADPAWGRVGTQTLRSIGASIIWRSPLGPLRFDWALPLDGPKRDPGFLFSLGSAF